MSLQQWLKDGWLRPHQASREEIAELYAVIERDLAASGKTDLDDDWRFAIAYNAALQSAAAALKAAGFEAPKGGGAHHRTIESLRLTIGDDGETTEALQAFRAKRAGGIYEAIGVASAEEVEQLRRLARALFERVSRYVSSQHPQFAPGPWAAASVPKEGGPPSPAGKQGRRRRGGSTR